MSANERRILCTCEDPGDTNTIAPIYTSLVSQGISAQLIPSGKAVELLAPLGLKTYSSAHDVLANTPSPRALVTGMCSKGGLGRDLIPLLRGRCPIVAVQDFWGSGLWDQVTWGNPQHWPDYIVVNDRVGQEIVLDAWPGFRSSHVKILGYPALDKYAHVDTLATRRSVKEKLGITDDLPLVLYASQLAGAATTLGELCQALNTLKSHGLPSVHLVPRLHPRMVNHAPDEFRALNQALQRFSHGYSWPFTEIFQTADLIQAADIVVSEWSTALVDAAAVRRTPLAVLYPDEGMARYRAATGNRIPEFPLVSLGCAAKAENRAQLEQLLSEAVAGELSSRLRPNQEQHFKLDGGNTCRVVDFIATLL